MGKVSVTVRVLPENFEEDMEKIAGTIKQKIPESIKFRGYQIIDIAFGLKAVLFNVLADDEKGGIEQLNQEIEQMSSVGSVEVVDLTLV
jgi:translation elongation factor aEF-1 beta